MNNIKRNKKSKHTNTSTYNKYKCFEVHLSNSSISSIADTFASATKFSPGDDLTEYVKRLGGKIIYDDSHLDAWGSGIKVNGPKDFTIYLTTFIPEIYDNFLIAHCLGHFVLHSILGKKHLKTDDRKEIDGFEKEANSFASEFLMPKKVITKMYKEDKDLSKLTEYFNMPLRYIDARLSQLKVKNYRSLSHD